MDNTKKWWQSKTVLSGIVITLDTLYSAIAVNVAPTLGWHLPEVPQLVYTIVNTLLGAVVVHGRVTADTKIAA